MIKYSCLFDVHRNIYNGIQLSEAITNDGKNSNNIYEFELNDDDFKSIEIALENMAYYDSKTNTLYFGYYETTRSSNSIVVFIATPLKNESLNNS